jgi:hypothetical protein
MGTNRGICHLHYTVTCLLKAVIAESEETAIARQWLCKHVSTATNLCDRDNDYAHNNRRIVGSDVQFTHRAQGTQSNTSTITFNFRNPITSWHRMLRAELKRQVAAVADSQHNSFKLFLWNYHRNINNNSAIRKEKHVKVKLWTHLKCWVFIVLIVCCSTVGSLSKYFSVVINMDRFINIRTLQC